MAKEDDLLALDDEVGRRCVIHKGRLLVKIVDQVATSANEVRNNLSGWQFETGGLSGVLDTDKRALCGHLANIPIDGGQPKPGHLLLSKFQDITWTQRSSCLGKRLKDCPALTCVPAHGNHYWAASK